MGGAPLTSAGGRLVRRRASNQGCDASVKEQGSVRSEAKGTEDPSSQDSGVSTVQETACDDIEVMEMVKEAQQWPGSVLDMGSVSVQGTVSYMPVGCVSEHGVEIVAEWSSSNLKFQFRDPRRPRFGIFKFDESPPAGEPLTLASSAALLRLTQGSRGSMSSLGGTVEQDAAGDGAGRL